MMNVERQIGLTPEFPRFAGRALQMADASTAPARPAETPVAVKTAGPGGFEPPATGLPHRLVRGRHGNFLYNAEDHFIGRSLEVYGEYSELEVQLLVNLAKPGDIVVEAGANIGSCTVPLARRVGADGWVLAVEPQRIVHQTLCANIALNGLANVIAPWCALGAAAGEISVPLPNYAADGNFGGISLVRTKDGEGERVPVATIDSFELPRCGLIKADVEGMELDVLKGAADTIKRLRPRLYVENDRQPAGAELVRHLLALGYRLFWHVPPLFNPRNFAGRADNVFDRFVSCNMLCLPPGDGAEVKGMRPVSGPEDTALQKQRDAK